MNCIHVLSPNITCNYCITENKMTEQTDDYEVTPEMIERLTKTDVLQMARQIYIEAIVPAVVQMGGLPKDADACAKIAITAAEIWHKEQEKYFKGETDDRDN
jgi:hypothetical protein